MGKKAEKKLVIELGNMVRILEAMRGKPDDQICADVWEELNCSGAILEARLLLRELVKEV